MRKCILVFFVIINFKHIVLIILTNTISFENYADTSKAHVPLKFTLDEEHGLENVLDDVCPFVSV